MPIPDYLAQGDRARLIPVAADSSKEVRAASILLATLSSVPAFCEVLLDTLGQRFGARSKLGCYTEVVFRGAPDQAKDRPDGLMVLESGGGRTWRCLVEAKIGNAEIEAGQVERYLTIAKAQKIDAVLTISNQFVALPTHSPLSLPKAALRGVDLFHWSWMHLLTEAELLLENQKIVQPEQRYILAEMDRYFSHPSVGVSTFDRMNSEWKDVNAQVQAGARLVRSPAVENSVAAWHQEVRDTCLNLSRKIGRAAEIRLSKAHKDDQALRLREDAAWLSDHYELRCEMSIPDAASPLSVVANMQRRSLEISMALEAPADKQKTSSRVNWLLRQIAKTDPAGIHVRAHWPTRAPDTQASLASLREDPTHLEGVNKALAPTRFDVLLVRDLAGKFAGAKTFVENVEEVVPYFYEQVGQYLRPYVAPPPRVRRDKSDTEEERGAEETRVETVVAPDGVNGKEDQAPATLREIAEASEATSSDASEKIQEGTERSDHAVPGQGE